MKRILTAALLALSLGAHGADMHQIVIHLDENDPARMNLVLNNAANVNK